MDCVTGFTKNTSPNDFNFPPSEFDKMFEKNNGNPIQYNADLVVFYSVFENEKSAQGAHAAYCVRELDNKLNVKGSGRTLIGKIVLNLAHVFTDSKHPHKFMDSMKTVLHEMFHILGF